MTIPRIPPYRLPAVADFPDNRPDWQVQPARAALLIHDMQRYFLNFFDVQQSPVPAMLQNIVAIRSACQLQGIPVFYTAQQVEQSESERGLLTDVWGPGLSAQPGQETIAEQVKPERGDRLLTKWRYSAFQRTELRTLLHQEGRDQLMICGVYAHIGCLMTAGEAFMNDIQPFLIGDAVADFSLDYHHMAMNYVAQRCGMTLSSGQLIDMLCDRSGDRAESDSPAQALSAAAIIQVLRQQLGELLQQPPQQVGAEENLLDWGLDSIRLMSLVETWRRRGAEVSFTDLAEQPTLAAWTQLLSRQVTSRQITTSDRN